MASVIKNLVKERGKTCVSIIVPTHRVGQDRQGDKLEIQRAVMTANQALVNKAGNFLSDIDSLFQQIDFKRNKEGIGIFVSPGIKKLVNFPFPVTEKVVVNKFFHLHDLIYTENYGTVYYLLDISKKEIHFFKGMMDHLEEIKDENFPKEIVDNYEYNKPSHSNSGSGYAHVKEVEKDKSIMSQIRLKKIFRQTDKLLSKYIVTKDTPLLLCGPEKDISIYRSATKHAENIVSSISDNYKGTSIHDLEVLAWLQIRSFIDEQKLKLVNEFKEKRGEGLGVYGIKKIWTAAKEGRGLVLLVEKDYGKTAFVTTDNRLFLETPEEKDARYCDVVDEIVNTVLEKKGKVIVMEKDILEDYERIALITRY
jgi:hypothetical protein